MDYFFIGVGGFFGAISRFYLSSTLVRKWPKSFPVGTFAVNILGSFLLGLFLSLNNILDLVNINISVGFAVGFLGAFTTFATYSYEIIKLMEDKQLATGLIYLVTTLVFCVLSVTLGVLLGQYFST